MMCVGDYSHPNHTERLLADKLFRGRVKEYTLQQGVSLPETVDWRTAGAVTFVKDQVTHLFCYVVSLHLAPHIYE